MRIDERYHYNISCTNFSQLIHLMHLEQPLPFISVCRFTKLDVSPKKFSPKEPDQIAYMYNSKLASLFHSSTAAWPNG